MLDHIELLASLVVGLTTIGSAIYVIWRWSFQVKIMIEKIENTECRLNTLEQQILRRLTQMQINSTKAGQENDRRLDRIEGKLNYIFGRTKITIPPKD